MHQNKTDFHLRPPEKQSETVQTLQVHLDCLTLQGSYLYQPGKCSTERDYASISKASTLLHPSIRMTKIISGIKVEIKIQVQDVLRTRVLVAQQ